MALGAGGRDIVTLVLARGLLSTGAGLIAGLAIARICGRYLVPFLFGIEADDLAAYLLVACLVVVLSCAVSMIPAFRALSIKPARVLAVD